MHWQKIVSSSKLEISATIKHSFRVSVFDMCQNMEMLYLFRPDDLAPYISVLSRMYKGTKYLIISKNIQFSTRSFQLMSASHKP